MFLLNSLVSSWAFDRFPSLHILLFRNLLPSFCEGAVLTPSLIVFWEMETSIVLRCLNFVAITQTQESAIMMSQPISNNMSALCFECQRNVKNLRTAKLREEKFY